MQLKLTTESTCGSFTEEYSYLTENIMYTLTTLSLTISSSARGFLDCGIIKFNRNTGIKFDRIAIIKELLKNRKDYQYPTEIINGIENAMRLVSLDYRNLKQLVKIHPNIPKKVIINLTQVMPKTIDIVVGINLVNQIAYINIEQVLLNKLFPANALKHSKYNTSLGREGYMYEATIVPTIEQLYKLVNSKHIVVDGKPNALPNVKNEQPLATNVPNETTINKIVEDIKLALKTNAKVLFHKDKVRTVKDIGICDMNEPLVIVMFLDNSMEAFKLSEHTASSIRKWFTREVSISF